MRVVAQRSTYASVSVDNELINDIEYGLVLLVSFTQGDSIKEIEYMANKLIKLRIFDDDNGVMNKSIVDVNGEFLSISQFTLYADTSKGNRPSYSNALYSVEANQLYQCFNQKLNEIIPTKCGVFGANMELLINNSGPVTIIIDSKE